MTDRIEEMDLNNFVVSSPESLANLNMCKHLLMSPQSFRLAFFHMEAHEAYHLMWGLINGWRANEDEEVDWCRISAADIMDEVISHVRQGRQYNAQKYVTPQTLIVEDLQTLEGSASQSEFYRILKKRMEHKKTTVLFSTVGIDHLKMIFRDDLLQFMNLAIKGAK